MLPYLLNILTGIEVLVVFNLMIIVHELGHFLAAKWRGLVIEKFGIWFGKPLWKKTIGGIEYSFGSIPFGGFVALPQMAPMEVFEGKSEARSAAAEPGTPHTHKTEVSIADVWVMENAEDGPATPRPPLPKVSALDKIIVAFAGPLFSFGLALFFATLVWFLGRPVSEAEATTTIGYVIPNSPAGKAGLKVGDQILSVDGHDVTRFSGMGTDSVTWDIVRSEGDTVPITVRRIVDGVTQTKTLQPAPQIEPTKPWERKGLREIGISPSQRPMVAKVEPGTPAEKAGLQPNDLITAIDGSPAYTLDAIADYANTHPAPSYTLDVERAGSTIQLPFTPLGARIEEVSQDGPADKAGIKAGDSIIAVDGKTMPDGPAVTEYVHSHGKQAIRFTIQNDKGTRDVTITPVIPEDDTEYRIGLVWDQAEFGIVEDAYGKLKILNPDPIEQVRSGMMSIFNTVGAITSRKSDIKLQHMGGPFMMIRVYYMFFQSREGWRLALWFSVVLNVNLALLNLLPIPVLDGGHITLALIEAVQRRPVNVRFLEIVQTSCALAIIGFMLYIAFFDVQDWFGGRSDRMRFKASDSAPAAQR